MKTYEGKLIAKDLRIGIVVSRFNEFITNKLLGGAIDGLTRHDVNENAIDVAKVHFVKAMVFPVWFFQ